MFEGAIDLAVGIITFGAVVLGGYTFFMLIPKALEEIKEALE